MRRLRPRGRALGVLAAALGAGCGASSVRIALAPTLDTLGRPGFEASLAVAAGWPLDLRGQSRHYLQARTGIGGAVAAMGPHGAAGGQLIVRGDLDSLHWALPRVDLRAGVGFARRHASDGPGAEAARSWSAAGYLALLPVVHQNDGGHPLVHQLCIGPELRAEVLFGDDGARRGLVSLPLLLELNLLMAGD